MINGLSRGPVFLLMPSKLISNKAHILIFLRILNNSLIIIIIISRERERVLNNPHVAILIASRSSLIGGEIHSSYYNKIDWFSLNYIIF